MTLTPPASPATPIVSSPAVPLTMTVSAAPSPPPAGAREVEVRPAVTSVPVRSLTVIVVGAAEGVEVDLLDAVEVHGDVADVAGEPHALAVGGDVDVLVDVGAVEQHACRCRPGPRRCRCRRPGPTGTTSSPAPRNATSLPLSPSMKSLPSPPSSVSAPWLPRIVSLPAPPSTVSLIDAGGQRGGVDRCRCRPGR